MISKRCSHYPGPDCPPELLRQRLSEIRDLYQALTAGLGVRVEGQGSGFGRHRLAFHRVKCGNSSHFAETLK